MTSIYYPVNLVNVFILVLRNVRYNFIVNVLVDVMNRKLTRLHLTDNFSWNILDLNMITPNWKNFT